MVFSKDDLSLIKILRQEKHYGAKRILKKFSNRNWSIATLNRLNAKIDATGSAKKDMVVVDYAQLMLLKMLILLKHSY